MLRLPEPNMAENPFKFKICDLIKKKQLEYFFSYFNPPYVCSFETDRGEKCDIL